MELRKYGSMDHPCYIDSLSALYIIYLAFLLPIELCLLCQILYFSIFFINGISSCLAHNPYVARNYPRLNYWMDRIDYLSIIIPLIFSPFFFSFDYLSFNYQLIIFGINCISSIIFRLCSKDDNLVYLFPIIFLISILFYYNRIFNNFYLVMSVIIALYSKINQNKFYLHTVWHIFGSLMLKMVFEIVFSM